MTVGNVAGIIIGIGTGVALGLSLATVTKSDASPKLKWGIVIVLALIVGYVGYTMSKPSVPNGGQNADVDAPDNSRQAI